MHDTWQEVKVLIWGKTYPELSSKYYETVCTGGVLENGDFIRLYPIPFRYLSDSSTFSKYQWLSVKIKKAKDDPRPESYKVDPASIKPITKIPTDKHGWKKREEAIFKLPKHKFDSAESLYALNEKNNTSLGFVRPLTIDQIQVEERPKEDYDDFLRKINNNHERSKQTQLFELFSVEEVKSLDYVSKRFKIHWTCSDPKCTGHKMSILDWEMYELVRKVGVEQARAKLETVLNLSTHDVGFFLGNFRIHPRRFAIGSLWYPQKSHHKNELLLFG